MWIMSVRKAKLRCRCTHALYFCWTWGLKIAGQAFVDHTQLLLVWFRSHYGSLCQLAALAICRASVISENRRTVL